MTDTTELQVLLDAATPGPWFVAGVRVKLDRQDTHVICQYDETLKRDMNIANVWYDPRTNTGHADAALISMTPALAAEVLRLTAVNAALVVRVEEARKAFAHIAKSWPDGFAARDSRAWLAGGSA